MTVRGEPIPPQTIETGPGVGKVARELDQRVLGRARRARRRARRRAIALCRAAGPHASVYIL
jgi:hypothetical protein